ncbi:hypothetical protein B0H63DRAFT_393875 [Podospora didyma]|uniref:F-box domain-containing protein n=1 Tax=Podospora didyma TaxID=330526 RepID=A0AAE0NQL3_9PEZI|nr:hypothetical protein B0H63DRAFT_393875 [Podospora didyma]
MAHSESLPYRGRDVGSKPKPEKSNSYWLMLLPNELTHEILGYCSPDDFESVLLTCKDMFAAGSAMVPKHNRMQKQFRHFSYNRPRKNSFLDEATGMRHYCDVPAAFVEDTFAVDSPLQLLRQIAGDPRTTIYIRSINFEYTSRPRANTLPYTWASESTAASDDKLLSLIRNSPYLVDAGVDVDLWINAMGSKEFREFEKELLAVTLLLTLLPNVREITPAAHWDTLWEHGPTVHDAVWAVLDVIVQKANELNAQESGASLAKLEVVKRPLITAYDHRVAFQGLTPFLAINNVREFQTANAIAKYDNFTKKSFRPRYDTYSRNLETMIMAGCVVGRAELSIILSRTPNVTTLRFSHETKWHNVGHNFNYASFLATTQKFLGKTLKLLTLSLVECYGGRGPAVVSLHGFKALETLEIDVGAFIGPAVDESSVHWSDEEDPDGPLSETGLVNILPPTLRTLRLYVGDTVIGEEAERDRIWSLFRGFREAREEKLPLLRNISLSFPARYHRPTRLLTTLHNVSVVVLEGDGPDNLGVGCEGCVSNGKFL